ncbi:MAG: efflux RND transporter periplasmic adaptor subunit [Chlamydiales bacterium]|nr:efflux RND transporter periplasmic adaptor subunit [Chlamydiales bacterium]
MIRFLFTAILAFLLAACEPEKKENPPVTVTAFRVERVTVPADFQFVGVAKSSHPVEIRSRVKGYLMSIDYIEGSMVDPGQLLFRIEPSQFEASLEQAKGELARQEAILWRAKRSLERLEPLYEQNAASQRDRDNALAQVLAGEASVISAQANVIQAELNLSYTYITSPIKGMTARARHKEGALIMPTSDNLLTLVSVIDPIWVDFSISDDQLLEVRAQEKTEMLILPKKEEYVASLKLADGSIFPHKGVVDFVSPTLDPQTGALIVRAQFDNPEGIVLPGQFVNAIISGAQWNQVITVPQAAVSQGQRGMFVFVVDSDNKVSRRLIQVGPWYENYWIIEQGLEPGDVVVVEGLNKVEEGSTVEVTSISSAEKGS